MEVLEVAEGAGTRSIANTRAHRAEQWQEYIHRLQQERCAAMVAVFVIAGMCVMLGLAVALYSFGTVAGETWSDSQREVVCPPNSFSGVTSLDMQSFIRKRWYVQQQMSVQDMPASRNRCAYTDYTLLPQGSFWGYELQMRSHAEEAFPPHTTFDSGEKICAALGEDPGKWKVAPCFLPQSAAGPYWILDYDEAKGYALVSGGPPMTAWPGGCRTGTGMTASGLWILTTQRRRDEAIVKRVREIASRKGFDLSVLKNVDQTSCNADSVAL